MYAARHGVIALALLATAGAAGIAQTAQPVPRIGRAVPAPPATTTLPPLSPSTIDDGLTIGGDDIDARKSYSRMTVPVRVNGTGPYQFLVDSGADTSVVGVRIARDLALPLDTPVVLNGMAARSLVARVKVDQLQLGESIFRNLALPALRENDVGGAGIIGIDALVNQRLLMDFENLSVKVEDARSRQARLVNGEIVVVAQRRRGQLILTQVRAAGVALEAVIDTGSEVTVGNNALRDRLVRRGEEFTKVEMTDVAGRKLMLQMAQVDELRVGSIILRDVPIAFADLPPFEAFGMSGGPALLLGTDLLETFRRVSLDFRGRKVRFQLRQCAERGIVISTSSAVRRSRISSENSAVCR